ncbi:MAG: hypothetical protein HQM09_23590 [Candidatus Riflebacteria bacterium]|nr:hypothetical protein [Candidatus Riflebacteria bacterium]
MRTFFLTLSMALVFRPGKCFLAQTVACVGGLLLLSWGKSIIGFERWVEYATIWLSANLLTSFGFLSHLLSCITTVRFKTMINMAVLVYQPRNLGVQGQQTAIEWGSFQKVRCSKSVE